MSTEDRRETIVAAGRKISARWYAVPAAVFLLGVLAIALLTWEKDLHQKQRANFALANVLMDLQIKTATAHLWLEESFVKDKDFDSNVRLVQSNLAAAVDLSNTILRGGETEHGLVLRPLRVPALLTQAEKISELMSEFGTLAELRILQPAAAGPGSALDVRFDRVFTELQVTIKALEIDAERGVVRDYAESRNIFYGINFAWLLIVVAATAGLGILAARKERSDAALQNAKDELEVKVAERTRELGNTNDQLLAELAERRRAEEALQENGRKFRNLYQQFHVLLDSIPDSITLLSPDLRILWANKGAVLAAKGAEVADRYCYRLWHDASGPCDGCAALRSFQTGMAENSQSNAPDGKVWNLRAFPMKGDGGRVESVIEIAEDITEKSMLQKQAERMAQLASLGELSAGVAHEINNPVNGIINCAEILMNKTGADSREHELGKRIIREGDRIAYIVKGLLSFSRQESEDMVPAQVRDLLADTLALTEAQLKKEGITLRMDADGEALLVRAQPQRLEQVFLNIINNARDALNEKYPEKHEGKTLSIIAKRAATDNGPRVRIIFRDQGAGIPAKVMSRIMNPFFSTKPRGKGTGLGLSISHGIVENHGGKLTIDSVEGESTEVVVELPLLEKG